MQQKEIGNSLHVNSLKWLAPSTEEEQLENSYAWVQGTLRKFSLKLMVEHRAKEREYVTCLWESAGQWAKDRVPKNELADQKEIKQEIEQCKKE